LAYIYSSTPNVQTDRRRTGRFRACGLWNLTLKFTFVTAVTADLAILKKSLDLAREMDYSSGVAQDNFGGELSFADMRHGEDRILSAFVGT
jgi:hypothetical protein